MSKAIFPVAVAYALPSTLAKFKFGEHQDAIWSIPVGTPKEKSVGLYGAESVEAYATARVREALEWQPIETAPRDGTWVRLWREPETIGKASPEIIAVYNAPTEYMSDGVWMWPTNMYDPYTKRGRLLALEDIKNGDFYEDDSFTHWMPLPIPPSTPA